eukprot:CAMPEP_0115745530 /NCGR_PEP_ID=MMETSP0272-20121206/92169_1 /TAXON_ID=71861 /ORGANISM="Scrippsiella trochoidea, Strain CCMP3099" /LENGTH=522 /DNA_ID=CAMNT_0003190443 /DNA_START=54 /DNA_END=1622 /DNA_ORIENTATION=-
MPAMFCCSSDEHIERNIVHPGAVVPVTPVREPEKLVINLYFRHFAWAYSAAFFLTLFVSGVVTFTASPYTPETDKITLFYGMFNPCIWFDHYPAKIFATTGMGIFLMLGCAYSGMVFVWVYVEKRMLRVMWSGAVIGSALLIDFVFVNVFTTNLYPIEEAAFEAAHGGGRRLHGVHFGANNTISLLEEGDLSQADINVIKLHTAFYILWVVGQLVLSLHLFKLAAESMDSWSPARKAWTIGGYLIGWYGMMMHAAAMLIIIMHPEPKVDWYFQKELSSVMQHMLIYLDAKTFTSAWGWVPIMCFRLVMPKGTGISLTFRLERTEGDNGWVMPEHWMNRCMWAMALVLAWAGIFDTDWDGNTHSCLVLLFVGLSLQVIQKMLLNRNRVPGLFAGHAILFWFLMFGCVLVILEKATWIHYVFMLAQLVFVAWVWHMNIDEIAAGNWTNAVAYTIAGAVIIVAAVLSCQFWVFFIYLAWISLYGVAVPDGPHIFITAARIEEVDPPYKQVPHNAVNPPYTIARRS